jgi:hypothetical protein
LGRNWDSFFLTIGIPKDPKGDLSLSAERVIPHHAEAGEGRDYAGRKDVGIPVPQQQIP